MKNDDGFDTMFKGFIFLWVFGFILSLGLLGVAVWAVISLVNHFT